MSTQHAGTLENPLDHEPACKAYKLEFMTICGLSSHCWLLITSESACRPTTCSLSGESGGTSTEESYRSLLALLEPHSGAMGPSSFTDPPKPYLGTLSTLSARVKDSMRLLRARSSPLHPLTLYTHVCIQILNTSGNTQILLCCLGLQMP